MTENTHQRIYHDVQVIDAGAEGKAIARINDKVVFIPFVAPGDVIDLIITKKRRKHMEGRALAVLHPSDKRTTPACSHFGICGGCKWQHITYPWQLHYKQKQVTDNLERIGKLTDFTLLPIKASAETLFYRNKLEFTFSNDRWLTREELAESGDLQETVSPVSKNGLGFHMPGRFDKVLDISTCYLQKEPSNSIRLALKSFAVDQGLSFYDARQWTGFLRNFLIRTTTTGDIMVILVIRDDNPALIGSILDHLSSRFPSITSFYYVINEKKNDALGDQDFIHYKGAPFIREVMPAFRHGDPDLVFRIGPTSFYQTNPRQAEVLYREVARLANLMGNERVFDLYSGTGTIAQYIAGYVKQVTGIESVEAAVTDARLNAEVNGISNVSFITGETERILDREFISSDGKPDLIITDPPRSGMHPDVISTILDVGPGTVIYVSCNPATQARDIALMKDSYQLVTCQPVDMFPQTHHVENIALLKLKETSPEGITATGS